MTLFKEVGIFFRNVGTRQFCYILYYVTSGKIRGTLVLGTDLYQRR